MCFLYNDKVLPVSIIIPARKRDFLLDECICNIRNIYPFVKIILILDEISNVNSFDENIIVLNSENPNMSAKRNLGISAADTEFIALIDSDAYPDINWLERSISFLQVNKDYTAVTGNQFLPVDDDFDKQCIRLVRFSKFFTFPKWNKVIDKHVKEQDCTEFMTSNVILRRNDYISSGGMNEHLYLGEDNEFSQRLIKKGFKIRFIPEVRVFHHECNFSSFMRKIFCMAYYYSNEFVKAERNKPVSEYLGIFLPVLLFLLSICLCYLGLFLYKEIFYALILPAFISLIFLFEAWNLARKLDKNKVKGYFYLLICFISFCVMYLSGIFLGICRIKELDIQKLYKHY